MNLDNFEQKKIEFGGQKVHKNTFSLRLSRKLITQSMPNNLIAQLFPRLLSDTELPSY